MAIFGGPAKPYPFQNLQKTPQNPLFGKFTVLHFCTFRKIAHPKKCTFFTFFQKNEQKIPLFLAPFLYRVRGKKTPFLGLFSLFFRKNAKKWCFFGTPFFDPPFLHPPFCPLGSEPKTSQNPPFSQKTQKIDVFSKIAFFAKKTQKIGQKCRLRSLRGPPKCHF
jgi:hypothetical protein